MRIIRVLTFCFVLIGGAQAEEPAARLADRLLAKSGISAGLVSLPQCNDPKLALALAQHDKMLVHAMSADRKYLDVLVRLADTEGVLSRSLYVEPGSPAALPYADDLVDLLVIADTSDADLPHLSVKEIVRVLSPGRGKAIIGQAKTGVTHVVLTQAALAAWAKTPDANLLETWEDDTGIWASIGKAPLAGTQGWTHRYHGPNNDAVSADATLKAPLMTQWMGLPLREGWYGTTIVGAGGRLFTLRADALTSGHHTLVARSTYNGIILWKRNLGVYNSARCCLVATPERLYLIDGDGVLLLNAETGAECGRWTTSRSGGQVKWMALSDNVLLLLTGAKEELKQVVLEIYSTQPNGTLLTAYDVIGGKRLWEHEESKPIDERFLAAHQGSLYACASGSRAFCLDVKTGQLRWENTDPALLALLEQNNQEVLKGAVASQKGLCVADHNLMIGPLWYDKMPILSTDKGTLLSVVNHGNKFHGSSRFFYTAGQWIVNNDIIDVTTGKSTQRADVYYDSCNLATATPELWIGGFGTCVERRTGKVVAPSEIKAPCEIGTIVSDGVIVTSPSTCRCNFEQTGYRALIHASLETLPALKPEDLLIHGSNESPAPLSVTPADWPTYRANIFRTASTPVKIPATVSRLWSWSLGKPVAFDPSSQQISRQTLDKTVDQGTPPICADGKIWFGDANGLIRCLNASDGRLIWSFYTGSTMFASPTVAGGRLYAGGGNGWIYCLNATTGNELWRFHAAPRDRQIMWYGHLLSTWPVLTGVLVHEGVAYAATGCQALNNVYVYALDAGSGHLRWVKEIVRVPNVPAKETLTPGVKGGLAIAGGRLWMTSGTQLPSSFDLKTGEMKDEFKGKESPKRVLQGGEIGCFAGRFVLYGGRRLVNSYCSYDERLGYGDGVGIAMFGLQSNGAPRLPEVYLLPLSTQAPAWDQDLMVTTRRYNSQLHGWSTSKLTTYLDEKEAVTTNQVRVTPKEFAEERYGAQAQAINFDKSPIHLWSNLDVESSSMALASNGLFVAYRGKSASWVLSGFDRESGQTLWSQNLPCEPVFNALCIDRNGRIIVGLRDGSVVCYGAP